MTDVLLSLIPLTFVILYAIFGGLAFGVPLVAALPGGHRRHHTPRFSPIWESAHVLLLGAVTSAAVVFPGLWATGAPLLMNLWTVIITLLAVRIGLVWLTTMAGWEGRFLDLTQLVVGLALPVILVQTATILLTGDADLLNHAGLAVTFGSLALALTPALWGGYFYRPGHHTRDITRWCYWLAVLLANFTLPMALLLDQTVLADRSLWSVMWPVGLTTIAGIVALMSERGHRYFAASWLLVVGITGTIYLALWPYVVRPVLLAAEAVTPQAGNMWLAGGFAVVAAMAVVGAYLLEHWAEKELKQLK